MEKSLLSKLETALSGIYGNTITTSEGEGVSHKDQYKCDCGKIITGEEWNEEYKMCRDCYMELAEDHNVPPFEGMDSSDSYGDR